MKDSGPVSRWRSWAPYLLSILRIVAAFLFMQVGTAKLFAFPGAVMPGGGTAPVGTLPWIAGFLETFPGLLLLIGLFARPVAFILSGEMAVAYFMGHAPQASGRFSIRARMPPSTRFSSSTSPRRGPGPGASTRSDPEGARCRSDGHPFVASIEPG